MHAQVGTHTHTHTHTHAYMHRECDEGKMLQNTAPNVQPVQESSPSDCQPQHRCTCGIIVSDTPLGVSLYDLMYHCMIYSNDTKKQPKVALGYPSCLLFVHVMMHFIPDI